VPYAVFPIYWNHDAAIPPYAYPRPWLRECISAMPNTLRDGVIGFGYRMKDRKTAGKKPPEALPWVYARKELNAFTLLHASRICVMSRAEIGHLKKEFPLIAGRDDFLVAPNGIWTDQLPEPSRDQRAQRVVFAGAYGPRKNQINLIRAAHGLEEEVVVLGYAAPGEARYAAMMRAEAPKNVRFLDRQDRSAYLELLNGSWVYAQPSYFELPGIAALEAAAMGCRMVLVDAGSVREYFADDALYVDPDDPEDICFGLLQALGESSPHPTLPKRIRETYNWQTCLEPFARKLSKTSIK
jgi:glycosyltransferase involved in cell wall biosynthesis